MATPRSLVSSGTERLALGPHPDRARQDAETILLCVLEKSRAWLLAHSDEELPDEQVTRFLALIERRYAGEPIQYILGEAEFYGLPFRVTPDVLIPRPETEHLVERVMELAALVQNAGAEAQDHFSAHAARLKSCPDTELRLSSALNALRIVDVGTGSGCIAITLAHQLPQAQITAIDLSARALAVAEENAKRNGFDLRFLQGDLLAPVSAERFDFVVSNPPYVPSADRDSLPVEVREFEPELALFAGEDGLAIYRRLIPAAHAVLVPGGFVALEIGYGQQAAIRVLLAEAGFEEIDFVPDLQGIHRVACGKRPG